ncbi:37732_t:CDS:2 [Gigaspora margarita]|uniref:37732_t:CDS:1 n=1 Tax=Gigaspora margarita TaxID=4874 RepID=A0ABN7UX13_GIGMA|nr:37732_t:CDS:2 [Gigaspora margarita]
MQRNKINQSLYYNSHLFSQNITFGNDITFDNESEIVVSDTKEDDINNSKATIQQLLDVVKQDKDPSLEPFIIADKYYNEAANFLQKNNKPVTYLCAIDKEKIDHAEQRVSILEQKALYSTFHRMYKKAMQKALQSKLSSNYLIKVLQKFTNKNDENDDELSSEESQDEDFTSDKENITSEMCQLQNPKRKQGRGRPTGTKRIKASCETNNNKGKQQQRRCKKCGNYGHY